MSLTGCIDMLLLFGLVMGGLFTGFFTPTEAGAVGAFGALLLAFLTRKISWRGLKECILDTLKVTGLIFMLLYGTTVLGQFLAVSRLPVDLAEWLVSLPIPNVAILVGILIIYLLGGCFMGGLAFMLLTLPVFYPVAESLGFDPIWFGVLMVIMVEMGSVTPPVGTGVYIIAGVAKDIPLEVIFKGIFPFIVAFALSLAILIVFPEIALFLPKLMS
ncbi:MAG: TRAP transporter large permease subunit [Deltaproteobacteria bacterium]|nr:TRAP transporter large permease subunit [Deltaproteobacteria bacterium]